MSVLNLEGEDIINSEMMEIETGVENDHNITSSSLALTNPMILDIVFAKLNTTALKSVRLVCHDWNDLASALLWKKTILSLKKMFPCDTVMPDVPQINPKLAKQVQVDECYLEKHKLIKTEPSFGPNFVLVAPLFCEFVEKMIFRVDGAGPFFPHMLEVLQQNDFPNLKEMCIEYIQHWVPVVDGGGGHDAARNYVVPALRPLPSLKSFSFKAIKVEEGDRYERLELNVNPVRFRSIFPRIITAAGANLEELDVAEGRCPNLNGSSNLKVLIYTYQYNRTNGDLNVRAVLRMLQPVKDSLEKFDLDLEYAHVRIRTVSTVVQRNEGPVAMVIRPVMQARMPNPNPRPLLMAGVRHMMMPIPRPRPPLILNAGFPPHIALPVSFKLPKMLNLTCLTLRAIPSSLRLDTEDFPKLVQLNLLASWWLQIPLASIRGCLPNRNQLITSLQLGVLRAVGDNPTLPVVPLPPILANLLQLFPSLKNFEMGFDLDLSLKNAHWASIKNVINTFHAWRNLDRIDLNFIGVEFELIPDLIEILITLDVLKTITFSGRKEVGSLILFFASDEIKAALLSCERLERVTIFVDETNDEFMNEMKAFVQDHRLPIEFKWPAIIAQSRT